MKSRDNPVVFTFETEVSIGGPPPQSKDKALKAFNIAWGFTNGSCNQRASDGSIVGRPGADDPAFQKAAHRMNMYQRLILLVHIHKDGQKTFELKQKA